MAPMSITASTIAYKMPARITSYNVCYTKLLRSDPEEEEATPAPEVELLNDVTQHYLNEIGAKPLFTPEEEYVITSYSIHYTKLYECLVGHVRGGLGYVVIIASVIFAGLSGSAVADAAALGAILIPMMVQMGYDKALSVALICASAMIAPIIPPSIPFILYGVAGQVSIGRLFMAGIVPRNNFV